jgi:hypothetical protein
MSKQLPSLVLEALEPSLAPLGFKLAKGKKWFVRRSPGRTETFQVVVLNDKQGFRVSPSVGVRFDDVEDIFHRTSGYEPEYQKDTATVGVDLWRVHGKEGFQIPLSTESDVPAVASRLLTIFRAQAEPFFARFNSLSAVDAALNERPTEPSTVKVLPWLRASTGAIAARLTGREDYDQLVATYRSVLQNDSKGFYLPRFEALLSDLAKVKAG